MAETRRFSLRTLKKTQENMTGSLVDKRTSPAPKVYDLNRSEYLHSARHHPAAYYFRSVNVMPRDPGPLSGLTMEQRNSVRNDCYNRQKVYYEEFRIRETAKIVKTIAAEKEKIMVKILRKYVPRNCFEAHQTRMKTKKDLERKEKKKAIAGKIASPVSGEALKLRSGKKLAKKT